VCNRIQRSEHSRRGNGERSDDERESGPVPPLKDEPRDGPAAYRQQQEQGVRRVDERDCDRGRADRREGAGGGLPYGLERQGESRDDEQLARRRRRQRER